MDFETTPKATLFFFFYSSFILLLFAALWWWGEQEISFRTFYLKRINLVSPKQNAFSLLLFDDAKEVVRLLLESEKTLFHSLFSHPSLPARAFRRVSRMWRDDDRDSRDAQAPFEQKISVDATDKSQLFYLKRKFSSPPVLFCEGIWRKAQNERKLRLCSFLSFSVLFLSFASSYSFFPSD